MVLPWPPGHVFAVSAILENEVLNVAIFPFSSGCEMLMTSSPNRVVYSGEESKLSSAHGLGYTVLAQHYLHNKTTGRRQSCGGGE